MLIYLEGEVIHKENHFLILKPKNYGLRIFFDKEEIKKIKKGEKIKVFIHEYLREDEREFYGFFKLAELKLFWELLKVSGVGPKSAQSIVALGEEKIKKAIEEENVALLTDIPGIGRKTAQKIILELH